MGCSNMSAEQFESTTPKLVLEEYFVGKSRAYGILFGRNGQVKRQFTVEMFGEWDGETLTLDEKFFFSDGEKQSRIWKVKKLDAHTYSGTAHDVVATAIGKQFGSVLQWNYVLKVPVDNTTYDITFNDWMFLYPDGILLNRATMTKFGFRVGELFLSFQKISD